MHLQVIWPALLKQYQTNNVVVVSQDVVSVRLTVFIVVVRLDVVFVVIVVIHDVRGHSKNTGHSEANKVSYERFCFLMIVLCFWKNCFMFQSKIRLYKIQLFGSFHR